MDDNLFLPISTLNSIRREALQFYENVLLSNENKTIERKSLEMPERKIIKNKLSITLCIHKLTKEYLNINNVSDIYVPIKEVLLNKELFCKLPFKKYILLPTITKNNYDKLIRQNIEMLSKICDGFVLSNIGQLSYFNNIDTNLIANYTFNVFNDFTIKYLKNLKFSRITLSPELSKNRINSLFNNEDTEFIVYGRTCLMTSEYCPVRKY